MTGVRNRRLSAKNINRYLWFLASIWTFIIFGFLLWDVTHIRSATREQAVIEASENNKKDQAFRNWRDSRNDANLSITMKGYFEDERREITGQAVTHGFIWILGLAGLRLGSGRIRQYLTEWDAAEERLITAQQRIRAIIAAAGEGIIAMDNDSRISFVNEELCRIFGYSEEELLYKNLVILIPEKFREAHAKGIKRYLDGGTPKVIGKRLELEGLRKDGSIFPLELRIEETRLLKDNEKIFTAAIRDITERRQAEQALSEKTAYLDNILRSSVDLAIAATDLDFRIQYYNPMAEKLFGYTAREVIGRTVQEIHTKEKVDPSRFDQAIEIIRKEGEYCYTVTQEKDGKTRIINSRVSGITDKNYNLIGFVLMSKDVTRTQAAEEERARLEKAIEQTAEIIIITDADANIQYVNPAFERITGYTREKAIGKNPRMLNSGKHSKEFYKMLWDTITAGKVWSGRFVNRSKDGMLYDEEATISPVMDSKGKIVNYVAVKRDVTYENMLHRARDYFTSVTSHELRTPLTKLQLAKMLLEEEYESGALKPGKMDQMIFILDESYKGLNRILSATTLLADLSVSQEDKDLHHVFLCHDLLASIETARTFIINNNRRVVVRVDISGLPNETEILGNQVMVIRAIDNILSNATKYTPDGKGIMVTGRIEGETAVIEISDDGIGIPKEKIELIFEPYFSLEDILRHSTGEYAFKGGGLGLGLALARMIMEYHGGKLTVKSEGEDRGTTVTMYFPISKKYSA